MKTLPAVLAFTLFFPVGLASASELVLPREKLKALGLKPTIRGPAPKAAEKSLPARNTLWPVTFKSTAHSIAQNYVQHQNYGDGQYYHGGCDLRAEPRSWAVAPISGTLEAGYYGYETQIDGQDVKWWKPWNGRPTASLYFEVAVTDENGFRYELHHVDPLTLPANVVQLLNESLRTGTPARVEAGMRLALVSKWPTEYDHVHYNIVRSDGVRVNPEFVSQTIPEITDTVAPHLIGVFAITGSGRTLDVAENSRLPRDTVELVVATTETRNGNAYVQTPPFFELAFASGEKSGWDFRQWLGDASGAWIDIRRVFLNEIRTPTQGRLRNSGNYGEGQFLVRIPVPSRAHGAFTLTVGDTVGNSAVRSATID